MRSMTTQRRHAVRRSRWLACAFILILHLTFEVPLSKREALNVYSAGRAEKWLAAFLMAAQSPYSDMHRANPTLLMLYGEF